MRKLVEAKYTVAEVEPDESLNIILTPANQAREIADNEDNFDPKVASNKPVVKTLTDSGYTLSLIQHVSELDTWYLTKSGKSPEAKNVMGVIDLEMGLTYPEVNVTALRPQYQGKGLGVFMYKTMIKHYGILISDSHVSMKARAVYERIVASDDDFYLIKQEDRWFIVYKPAVKKDSKLAAFIKKLYQELQ